MIQFKLKTLMAEFQLKMALTLVLNTARDTTKLRTGFCKELTGKALNLSETTGGSEVNNKGL